MLLGLLLTGCHEEVEQRMAQLDISLCLPANEVIHREGMGPRRVMGDPGLTEQFELPQYAYIFVMKQESGGVWSVWRCEKKDLNTFQWVKRRYNGFWDINNDSIFQYRERIVFPLQKELPVGKVYTICSNVDLDLDSDGKDWDEVTDLDDVLNLKFNTSSATIQRNLQNIYSTPYNYAPTGDYYCSFDCSSGNSFHVDMLLYHVAAKVDLKWNVEDSVRINKTDPAEGVRLTYLEARRLFNGYAYCFKPMKNMLSAMPGSGEGYDIADIVIPTAEGLWWEGRSYFYTIPYFVSGDADYFPLQMLLGTNGTKESAGYQLTLKQPMDTSAVFVPWLRGDFKLSQPLGTQTVTKTIER